MLSLFKIYFSSLFKQEEFTFILMYIVNSICCNASIIMLYLKKLIICLDYLMKQKDGSTLLKENFVE